MDTAVWTPEAVEEARQEYLRYQRELERAVDAAVAARDAVDAADARIIEVGGYAENATRIYNEARAAIGEDPVYSY